jgi:hypothetical protein
MQRGNSADRKLIVGKMGHSDVRGTKRTLDDVIDNPGGLFMGRMIKDYVQVGDHASLDQLIERLTEIRNGLGHGAEAEMRIRGDDVFGRHLCIAFLRPLTSEEAACVGRYAEDGDLGLRAAA